MADFTDKLFNELLGGRGSLEEALNKASEDIAAIGERNSTNSFRSVTRNGVSVTQLYEDED